MAKSLSILSAGGADPRVQEFLSNVEETIEGILTGRVTGVDPETRDAIEEMWNDYREREHEIASDSYERLYTNEEERALEIVGQPEKYAEPRPEKPRPMGDMFRLIDILPPYDLAEFTKRLSEEDIEGAKGVLDRIERAKLRERIRVANLPLFDRVPTEPEVQETDPFEDTE